MIPSPSAPGLLTRHRVGRNFTREHQLVLAGHLVETFLARGAADECQAGERRASSAAEVLTREKRASAFGGSIHDPEEEICFFAIKRQLVGVQSASLLQVIAELGRQRLAVT